MSHNLLQWFDYAFIPKNLQVLDISDNRIEELGNYYKLEGGFRLRTLRAERNRIKGLRPLSLPSSVERAQLRENRIRLVEPGSFSEKENVTVVDLRANLLRQLELSAVAVKSSANAGSAAGKCGSKNKQTKMPPPLSRSFFLRNSERVLNVYPSLTWKTWLHAVNSFESK